MKLKPLASNMTEIEFGSKRVLFSYQTPVAYKIWDLNTKAYTVFVTDKFWSHTTSRHINKWLKTFEYEGPVKVSQSKLDELVK